MTPEEIALLTKIIVGKARDFDFYTITRSFPEIAIALRKWQTIDTQAFNIDINFPNEKEILIYHRVNSRMTKSYTLKPYSDSYDVAIKEWVI